MKKDVLIGAGILAAGALAFYLTAPAKPPVSPTVPTSADPRTQAARLVVTYRVEGQADGLRYSELAIPAEGAAEVRFQAQGGGAESRSVNLAAAQREAVVAALRTVSFFTVDEVPRLGYRPELPTLVVTAELDGKRNEVRIDGRTRASASIDPLLQILDGLRKGALPPAAIGRP